MWMGQMVFFKVVYRSCQIATNDVIRWMQPTNYIVSHYHLKLAGPRVVCFALLSQTCRPLKLFFYKKKGAVGPTPKARARSLASKGSQMQELKTCLREYCLPLRVINGRNMMPKATFGQTGWHWFGDIRQICVHLSTTHPMM